MRNDIVLLGFTNFKIVYLLGRIIATAPNEYGLTKSLILMGCTTESVHYKQVHKSSKRCNVGQSLSIWVVR